MSQLTKKFKARNAAFEKADRAGKRVLIAKDVLAMLKAEKYEAETGVWARFHAEDLEGHQELASATDDPKVTCDVCGIGAVMLSTIRYVNDFKIDASSYYFDYNLDIDGHDIDGEFTGYSEEFKKTRKYFSESQLRLIEIAFERGYGRYRATTTPQKKAKEFGEEFGSHNARLIAIMANIVTNKGVFNP